MDNTQRRVQSGFAVQVMLLTSAMRADALLGLTPGVPPPLFRLSSCCCSSAARASAAAMCSFSPVLTMRNQHHLSAPHTAFGSGASHLTWVVHAPGSKGLIDRHGTKLGYMIDGTHLVFYHWLATPRLRWLTRPSVGPPPEPAAPLSVGIAVSNSVEECVQGMKTQPAIPWRNVCNE